MFKRMLVYLWIMVRSGATYRQVAAGESFKGLKRIGPVAQLFDGRFGALPYRNLWLRNETLKTTRFADVGAVSYPQSKDYARVSDYKHMAGQGRANG